MTLHRNRHDQLEKRRLLRREVPPAERLLWRYLRDRGLGGHKFRRQYSVGPFVLDFCCPAAALAIELDGPTHEPDLAREYDAERQAHIERLGFRFLRFTNAEVRENLEGVLATILAEADRGAGGETAEG